MGRTARGRTRKRKLKDRERIENEQTVTRLKSWLLLHNCSIPHLIPYDFPVTGRGLKTLKDLSENDVIVKLPLELLVTTSTVSHSYVGNLFVKDEYYSAQWALSLFLIYERHLGSESKWSKYIATLPKNFTNPDYCSSKEKNLLPSFISDYMRYSHKLKNDFDLLNKSMNNLCSNGVHVCPHCCVSLRKIFTFSRYRWAYYVVNTRAVYIDTVPKHKASINIKEPNNLALAPFLDFLNHDTHASVRVDTVDDSSGKKFYQLSTLKSFSSGSQVFINYGSHDSLKLYVDYGFFIPNNPLDEVCFDVSDISSCSVFSTSKLDFIKLNGFHKNMGFTRLGLNYNATCALFIVSTPLQREHWGTKLYGGSFTSEDMRNIKSMAQCVLCLKRKELVNSLDKMRVLNSYTQSFTIAIGLVEEYLQILRESEEYLNMK